VALHTEDVLPADACFHAQQCAEKALMALLVHLQVPFPRTHVLDLLVDLVKDEDIEVPLSLDEAIELTQYAVETRYPGAWEPVDDAEAAVAVDHAAAVLNWVENQVPSST